MECDICLRPATSRLPFNCTTCARNAIYEPRLQHARVLLQKEALGNDVKNAVTRAQATGGIGAPPKSARSTETSSPSRLYVERLASEQYASTERTQIVLGHVEALREGVKEIKADIAKRKALLIQRRAALASASKELGRQESTAIEPFHKSIGKTENRWQATHKMSAEARIFLCREAAQLYALKPRKRQKGEIGRDSYMIGGVPIVDLRDMNNADPAQVSTTIAHLAHLLHLTSHYLSLRLPAEISLPNASHPYPTISSPFSSYTNPAIPSPPLSKSSSSSSSQRSAPPPSRPVPRPRPLHLDKPLHIVAKEDALAYSYFVDAVTLLAWDIAWICKTQGLDIGAKSWEDVCAIGRNTWLLFVSPPVSIRPPPSTRTASTSSPAKPVLVAGNPDLPPSASASETSKPSVTIGYFSHNSTRGFLASAEGTEYMRGWKLASPVRIIEKVKSVLASERMGAEWEMLEDGEWEEDGNASIGKGGRGAERDDGGTGDCPAGEKAVPGVREGVHIGTLKDGKGTGTSGWTKLKSRAGEFL